MREQITYDEEAGRAYIYLTDFQAGSVAVTEELAENDDIMIDFGLHVPVVGIELEGKTAQKVKHLNGTADIFIREATGKGFKHSFCLHKEKVVRTATHPDAPNVVFLFSDEACSEFVGIDLYETGAAKRI